MNQQAQYSMPTPLGPVFLVASEKGLRSVYFGKQAAVPMIENLEDRRAEVRILAQAVRELNQYFAGKRTRFETPLDLAGTDFQLKVWNQLLRIPYGQTCSYSDIARRLNNDKAVRAVGTANGRNPICILIPCHRVIAADGSLGGYSGGLDKKMRLLELEQGQPRLI